MMTAEWTTTKKEDWSDFDILVEAARIVYEREQQRAKREKSNKTVSEEEENEKRFFSVFPRKSRSLFRIARRYPQIPFENLNGASTSTCSSSLFDLNMIPCDLQRYYSRFLGDYTIAADSETETPQNPRFSEPSSSPFLEYNTAESEMENPRNPNSQLSLSSYLRESKSRKRCAVQQRKPSGGLKKAKVVPFSWVGKEKPEWLVQVMRDMNVAGDAELIFEKVLSSTDVKPSQSRLLLPFNQLHRNDFLTPDESIYIRSQGGNNKPGVKAILVNQSSEMWSVNFKIWEMKKDSGKGSLNYVLNYGWNDVVQANRLKEYHTISLWSFRCQEILCFALVRPPNMP